MGLHFAEMQALLVSPHQAPSTASDSKDRKTKVRRALQIRILFASAALKHKRHTINDDQNKFLPRQASFKIGLNIVNQKHETTLSTNHALKKRPRQAQLNLANKRVKEE